MVAVAVVLRTPLSLAHLERVVVLAEEGVVEETGLVVAPALPVAMAVHLGAARQRRRTEERAGLAASVLAANARRSGAERSSVLAAEQVGRVATVAMEPAGQVGPVGTEPQAGRALVVLAAPSG